MEHNLCKTCIKADIRCPVWYPGKQTSECSAYYGPKDVKDMIEADTLTNTLAERGKSHGDANIQFLCAQMMKAGARGEHLILTEEQHKLIDLVADQYAELSPVTRECVDMIIHKLTRVICGQEDFQDHWHDIQGYAKLAEENVCMKSK